MTGKLAGAFILAVCSRAAAQQCANSGTCNSQDEAESMKVSMLQIRGTETEIANQTGVTHSGGSCTGNPCTGLGPCVNPCDCCRSKWDNCGQTSDYCNAQSIWTCECNGDNTPRRRATPPPRRRGPSPPPRRRSGPSPPSDYRFGGYCGSSDNCPLTLQGDKSSWSTQGGNFCAGNWCCRWGSSAKPKLPEVLGQGNYLVLGGAGTVTSGSCGAQGSGSYGKPSSATELKQWMDDGGFTDVDFDMEGWLHNNYDWVDNMVSQMKKIDSGVRFQITVMAGSDKTDFNALQTRHQHFNSIGLMLYGNAMEGSGWGLDVDDLEGSPTRRYMKQWRDSNILRSKMLLGMTTVGLESYMVDYYKQLLQQEHWAGIFFWKYNKLGNGITQECIQNMAANCDD